jgi:hypothetical protein
MKIIINKFNTIQLPWEPGLLEWLNKHYPYSKYYEVELT